MLKHGTDTLDNVFFRNAGLAKRETRGTAYPTAKQSITRYHIKLSDDLRVLGIFLWIRVHLFFQTRQIKPETI